MRNTDPPPEIRLQEILQGPTSTQFAAESAIQHIFKCLPLELPSDIAGAEYWVQVRTDADAMVHQKQENPEVHAKMLLREMFCLLNPAVRFWTNTRSKQAYSPQQWVL